MQKHLVILGVVLLISIVFWFSVRAWVLEPTFTLTDYARWAFPLLMLLLLSAVAIWAFVLLEPYYLKLAASVLMILPIFVVFGPSLLYILAIVIGLIFHLRAINNLTQELKARITINPNTLVKVALGSVMAPMLIAVSFAYYSSPSVQLSAQRKQLPSAIKTAVEDTTRKVASAQLKNLPANERAKAESQVANEVMSQINSWITPYFKYLPPILAFGLFLFLQGLAFIFNWLASWIALGLFSVLKKTGFVIIEEKEVKAQILHI